MIRLRRRDTLEVVDIRSRRKAILCRSWCLCVVNHRGCPCNATDEEEEGQVLHRDEGCTLQTEKLDDTNR